DYCKLKGLDDWDLMYEFGAFTINCSDQKPAVGFPYSIWIDGRWEDRGIKVRLSADSHDTFWAVGLRPDWWCDGHWRKATSGELSTVPYGLSQVRAPVGDYAKDLLLVEGESDVHTLWTHNIPAL